MLNDAQRKLVEDNLNLCHFALHKKGIHGGNYEDYFQIACIGLCKAAEKFDPMLNHKFSSYAMTCIYNELRQSFRSQRAQSRKGITISLDKPLEWAGKALFVRDLIPSTSLAEDSLITHEIQDCVRALSPKQQLAINLFMQGYNTAERAKAMGMTVQGVGSATAKARNNLIKRLGIERE